MKRIVVLAMHGMPPKDFPEAEKKEFMTLHARHGSLRGEELARHDALEKKMRSWPRSAANDAFHEASEALAREVQKQSGSEVIAGYNEFCAPDLQEAFALAVKRGAEHVSVVTPMVMRGGSHSEVEIPHEISLAKKKYPSVHFQYAWPFPVTDIAAFLIEQVESSN